VKIKKVRKIIRRIITVDGKEIVEEKQLDEPGTVQEETCMFNDTNHKSKIKIIDDEDGPLHIFTISPTINKFNDINSQTVHINNKNLSEGSDKIDKFDEYVIKINTENIPSESLISGDIKPCIIVEDKGNIEQPAIKTTIQGNVPTEIKRPLNEESLHVTEIKSTIDSEKATSSSIIQNDNSQSFLSKLRKGFKITTTKNNKKTKEKKK